VKAVPVSGTDSTVNSGPAAVQIGTALFVEVSAFQGRGVNCLQLEVVD
jgi:hypothetical protein